MPKIADIKNLEALGFQCIPCEPKSKVCKVTGWPDKVFTTSDFNESSNVGVKLGQKFVDIDIDDVDLIPLAHRLLPPTNCRWGRKSRAESHWLYNATGKTKTFSLLGDGVLIEFRSENHYTVAPGSIHPTGEPVRFDAEGVPSQADAVDLLKRVTVLALLGAVRGIWSKGNHHHTALAVAAILAKAGYAQDLALCAIRALASLPSGGDMKSLQKDVATTYARYAEGEAVAGISKLSGCGLGEVEIKAIESWLPPLSPSVGLDGAAKSGPGPSWGNSVTTVGEYRTKHFPPNEMILSPWLMKGDICLLYGLPGHGKTLVALSIADALSRGSGFGGCCSAPKPRRVLYIEGELGGTGLQEHVHKLDVHSDVLLVPSSELLASNGLPNIADAQQQEAIIAVIADKGVEVVILDNLFCLAVFEDINSNSDKGIISLQHFAARLRNLGVTSIFVHHATKASKGFNGATRLEVTMDLTIEVKQEGQRIGLKFTKNRGRSKPAEIDLSIEEVAGGIRLGTAGLLAFGNSKRDDERKVLKCLSEGMSSRKMVAYLKWSKDKVPRVLKACVVAGYAKKKSDGKNASYVLTDAGLTLLQDGAKDLDGDAVVALP